MGSPFAWALLVTFRITDSRFSLDPVAPWAMVWLFIMAIAAVTLLIAILADFDRKLGRGEIASSRLMNGIFSSSSSVAALATRRPLRAGLPRFLPPETVVIEPGPSPARSPRCVPNHRPRLRPGKIHLG